MDKEDVVHLHSTFTQWSTAKKGQNDLLKFKWMELENIVMSEVTQTEKDKYNMYSLISDF